MLQKLAAAAWDSCPQLPAPLCGRRNVCLDKGNERGWQKHEQQCRVCGGSKGDATGRRCCGSSLRLLGTAARNSLHLSVAEGMCAWTKEMRGDGRNMSSSVASVAAAKGTLQDAGAAEARCGCLGQLPATPCTSLWQKECVPGQRK